MLRIYGSPRSRVYRCIWMARELGVEFEHVAMAPGEARSREYLAINPNGRFPSLVDGDVVMWESLAINLYLAKKFDNGLAPRTLEEEAETWKWSFWGATECEPSSVMLLYFKYPPPKVVVSEAQRAAAERKLKELLPVLDGVLADRPYLLGERFTVADLNVAGVLSSAKFGGFDFSYLPHAREWLRECFDRPAQRASVRTMIGSTPP